jgi:hypothetical protein
MQRLAHCARGAREAVFRMSLSVAVALSTLTTFSVHPAAAEEATTAPTCTGCSGSQAVKTRSKPPRESRSAPRRTRSAPKPAAKPGINNEGSWSGVSKGPCIVTWRWTVEVTNGSISGKNTTGHVSRTGAASGAMVVFGKTYKFVGRFDGSTGAGTWKSVECGGTWTSAKS